MNILTTTLACVLGLGMASCVQDAGAQPTEPSPSKEPVAANPAAEMKTTALELSRVP